MKTNSLFQDLLLYQTCPVLRIIRTQAVVTPSLPWIAQYCAKPHHTDSRIRQTSFGSVPSNHVISHVTRSRSQMICCHGDVQRHYSLPRHGITRRHYSENTGKKGEKRQEDEATVDPKVWMLRLAHENSYLSWSRNAAICAGIAATVRIIDSQGLDPTAEPGQLGGADSLITGFADLGLVFIVYGSCHHLYQAYLLRKTLHLRSIEFFWVCVYTTAIGLLYCFLIQTKFGIFW